MKIWTLLLTFYTLSAAAQGGDSCSEAIVVCADQPQVANNQNATVDVCPGCEDGASASGNFCFALNNTTWFSFTTNETGGDVTVDFSNIICNSSAGFNTNLQAAIIAASTPCDESTYSLVSNCETGANSAFSLSASTLSPNTTYYIQVDGDSINGNTNPAECAFNINLSGPGIEVEIFAGTDTLINFESSITLNGQGPAGSIWTPESTLSDPTSSNPIATPEGTTTYYYSYTTDNGCTYTDDVQVGVKSKIFVTNTFTPNSDGINDNWYIGSIDDYPSAKVTVFDRWGQKVFNSVGYGNEKVWDGTFLGAKVPSGVYYYVIDLNIGSENGIFAGYVTLVR